MWYYTLGHLARLFQSCVGGNDVDVAKIIFGGGLTEFHMVSVELLFESISLASTPLRIVICLDLVRKFSIVLENAGSPMPSQDAACTGRSSANQGAAASFPVLHRHELLRCFASPRR